MLKEDILQHSAVMAGIEGPKILWESLKGKKVKTSDGEELGEIKEITQNYIRVERGTFSKEKNWIPKYVADAYDGKVLWLLVTKDDFTKSYVHGEEPPTQQYFRDLETFKASPYGKKVVYLPDFDQNIRLTEERTAAATASPREDNYKNIRELD
jgi:hypothetical protein